MATNELPPRPNLEQLRTRAKELLRAARAGDAAALGRFQAQAQAQAQASGRAVRLHLAEAQQVIAREHGFPNWARLTAAVAARAVHATSHTVLGGGKPAAAATVGPRAADATTHSAFGGSELDAEGGPLAALDATAHAAFGGSEAAATAASRAAHATSQTDFGGSEAGAPVGHGAAAPGRIGRPTRRNGPRQTPGRAAIQALHAMVVEAASRGETFPFLFAPPIGPLPSAVQAPLRQALVTSGHLPLVLDVLRRGAEQPSPRVRAECAHALDWLGDSGCLPTLLTLADDPVPRVRWFALHALACDDCKLEPLSRSPEVVPLLRAKAARDPNARVRRRAEATLRLLGQG